MMLDKDKLRETNSATLHLLVLELSFQVAKFVFSPVMPHLDMCMTIRKANVV